MRRFLLAAAAMLFASAAYSESDLPFDVKEVAAFDEPWALAFLPNGKMLVTEKKGNLFIVTQEGKKSRPLGGVPDVDYGGQGGFGDVIPHPDFVNNQTIYLSYVEAGNDNTRGAAVVRAKLNETDAIRGGYLTNIRVIWRQYPKMVGRGHYGHRLLFDQEGYIWISSGDRQKFTPAQDMQSNIGKILRLNADGSVPEDNPFVGYRDKNALVDDVGVYQQIWSLGHRNPLGIAFDASGQLWDVEMGPAGGDELNRVSRGANYGYPVVSNGDHYDGREIPDHNTRPEFDEPAIWWTPVISPGDLILYDGELFPEWRDDLFVAGLSSQAIIRIEVDGAKASEAERFPMGARIRSIAQGPNGALWILEDERAGSKGRLLKLTPAP